MDDAAGGGPLRKGTQAKKPDLPPPIDAGLDGALRVRFSLRVWFPQSLLFFVRVWRPRSLLSMLAFVYMTTCCYCFSRVLWEQPARQLFVPCL